MMIDIGNTPRGRSSVQRKIVSFDEGDDWPRFEDGLDVRLESDRTGSEIAVRISFRGRVIVECARCLTECVVPVSGSCTVFIRKAEEGEESGFTDHDSLEYVYDADTQEVDLRQAVFDELVPTLPMKPLCRETCEGIDRGVTEQQSASSSVDPRWEALRKLKQ